MPDVLDAEANKQRSNRGKRWKIWGESRGEKAGEKRWWAKTNRIWAVCDMCVWVCSRGCCLCLRLYLYSSVCVGVRDIHYITLQFLQL